MTPRKPKLIVFDLDYTLWPFWVDTHVTPPFRIKSKGVIVDSTGAIMTYFPEVADVLQNLYTEGYTLGIASRTSEIKGANQLVDLFGWDKFFTYREIFPGSKVTHFENFKRRSNLDYTDMIFFDDERRNIDDVSKLQVTSVLVKKGVTHKTVSDGLLQYQKDRSAQFQQVTLKMSDF